MSAKSKPLSGELDCAMKTQFIKLDKIQGGLVKNMATITYKRNTELDEESYENELIPKFCVDNIEYLIKIDCIYMNINDNKKEFLELAYEYSYQEKSLKCIFTFTFFIFQIIQTGPETKTLLINDIPLEFTFRNIYFLLKNLKSEREISSHSMKSNVDLFKHISKYREFQNIRKYLENENINGYVYLKDNYMYYIWDPTSKKVLIICQMIKGILIIKCYYNINLTVVKYVRKNFEFKVSLNIIDNRIYTFEINNFLINNMCFDYNALNKEEIEKYGL